MYICIKKEKLQLGQKTNSFFFCCNGYLIIVWQPSMLPFRRSHNTHTNWETRGHGTGEKESDICVPRHSQFQFRYKKFSFRNPLAIRCLCKNSRFSAGRKNLYYTKSICAIKRLLRDQRWTGPSRVALSIVQLVRLRLPIGLRAASRLDRFDVATGMTCTVLVFFIFGRWK